MGDSAATDAAAWTLAELFCALRQAAGQTWRAPLQFAGQAAVLLLLGCAVSLIAGPGAWQRCLGAVCVLAFGAVCLDAVQDLLDAAARTAESCQNYLLAFIPVYSGAAAAGGQTGGAAVYGTMFLAMSNFLAWAIRRVLLPLLQVYFCLSVSSAVWNNAGLAEAANLFSRSLSFCLKCCGALFSFVLGLQNILAATADSAALRMGRSVLSGAIPVVGDAAAAALSGAVSAVQLLKGSLALAAVAALGAMFLPVFVRCALFCLAFDLAGVLALGSGQEACGQVCRTFSAGARLCGSMLVLYFFMVFLSTALLLLSGGGIG